MSTDTQQQAATPLLYLHGFLSSARGTKANFLAEKLKNYPHIPFHAVEFNPTPRDFEFMSVTGQINRLRQYVLARGFKQVRLIGSSLGGQVALNYARRYGGVVWLLLLAPALHYSQARYTPQELAAWQSTGQRPIWHDALGQEIPLHYDFHLDRLRYAAPPPPPAPTVIIHGRDDEVVPLAGSQSYAAAHPQQVTLLAVDSDHRLGDQLDLIWQQVELHIG